MAMDEFYWILRFIYKVISYKDILRIILYNHCYNIQNHNQTYNCNDSNILSILLVMSYRFVLTSICTEHCYCIPAEKKTGPWWLWDIKTSPGRHSQDHGVPWPTGEKLRITQWERMFFKEKKWRTNMERWWKKDLQVLRTQMESQR